ncbi:MULTISPECIES: mycothiol synthase [unclassified Curtobacterium]|uniref:mycothiol synthase n=1 Tax=unclassified Curtobacterium TaxID=257496 RepID=UPI0008DC99AB|nr:MULTISPECIES: mycothiol synthase [unclassified Curtobacterium]OIH98023.1 mycothiol synthase [Curtobacterium sp. MCBA15_003]OII32856.1 mycothiol synthase [Curtobacterium sp. MMLR14_006]
MLPDLDRFVVPDEAPPFSDQTLVDVRAGRATVLGDERGVAVVRDGELELVVAQEARGRGLGTALVEQALALGGGAAAPRLAWAHGDHPAARSLAARSGWTAVRTLLQLHAPIASDAPDPAVPDGYSLAAFRAGDPADEADWLALNAAAFAHHPEQGRMTLDDLHAREADAWFDGDDLLLLRDAAGRLAGSCWLKVEDGIGEFYAVAVRPDLQGQRLGGVLMRAGTARLTGRGLTAAALYVEGDNEPALALYRRAGFTQHAIDVQYAAPSAG